MLTLTDDRLLSCLAAVVAAEIEVSRRTPILPTERLSWTIDTSLGPDGLDLDSLEMLGAATAVNQLFHLHESGIEDYLMAHRRLGDWVQLVRHGLDDGIAHLSFRTSGSTGEPIVHAHSHHALAEEVAVLADLLKGVHRIVSFVPAHHIYGFLFTVALPGALAVPVVEGLGLAPGALKRLLAPDDLMVAHPTLWSYLSRSLATFTPGLAGVSSTAPLPVELNRQLRQQGLDAMLEVYGSSETAGIASRWAPDQPFTLFPQWQRVDDDHIARGADGAAVLVPDRVRWPSARTLVPVGRRDNAVQVGGVNVHPRQVVAQLEAHEGVREAAVRLDPESGRLKAFVVPMDPNQAPDVLRADLDRWCRQTLTSAQRPRAITIGAALPRNQMGKLADWPAPLGAPVDVAHVS